MTSTFVIGGTQLVFGAGSSKDIVALIAHWAFNQLLLVSDAGVMGAGLLGPIEDAFEFTDTETHIFSNVEENPKAANVVAGVHRAKEVAADGLIAVGGGSVIDTAKAIALILANDCRLEDVVGEQSVPLPPRPLIAVPTTAGSGSEVSRWSVITVKGQKEAIGNRHLYPHLTLADPQMTLTLSASMTAYGAIDALTHAVEAVLSPIGHPFSRALGREAIKVIFAHLENVLENPEDLHGRTRLLEASLMAGMAFDSASLGPVHGLSQALGGAFDLPHGLLNALFLPGVLKEYQTHAPDQLERLPAVSSSDRSFLSALQSLIERIALPHHLERDLSETALNRLAHRAYHDQGMGVVPLSVATCRSLIQSVVHPG